ncbi:ion channel [Ruegeria sp. ANG-R]|uniref:ion channel n=1 Tax=Ruegeria sp. ANG-R TaxID=1577903 RepID=UPI00187BCAD4|nr:ion channel [Ruegeria sp. ANG-R]
MSKVNHRATRIHRGGQSLLVIVLAISTAMGMMTIGIWMWAVVYHFLAVFPDLESATYYTLIAYTTLGLGESELPKALRILGGMTAANGFLMFGMMTAMLTDVLNNIRRKALKHRDR